MDINNNIKPYFWGPKVWYTIFSFVAVYPDNPNNDIINATKQFFTSIEYLLPCKSCRNSYKKNISDNDTNINNINNFTSRNNLIEFVFNLRNKVNSKTEIEYYITLIYFKKKLNFMICEDDNKIDAIVNNLIEAPIIPESLEQSVYNYINKKTNYNTKNTKSIIKTIKHFMINPVFNLKDSNFKLFCKRNTECRSIIKKIYYNMSINNYSKIESFKYDNDLHLKLLYLGSSVLSKSELIEVL